MLGHIKEFREIKKQIGDFNEKFMSKSTWSKEVILPHTPPRGDLDIPARKRKEKREKEKRGVRVFKKKGEEGHMLKSEHRSIFNPRTPSRSKRIQRSNLSTGSFISNKNES